MPKCLVAKPCAGVTVDVGDVVIEGIEIPPPPRILCLTIWTPDADGDFTCGTDYWLTVTGDDNTVVNWSTGLDVVTDPTAGLTEGVDYIITPCGGEPAAPQYVTVPIDLNGETDVDQNILDGTLTLDDLNSITVVPCIPDPDENCEVICEPVRVDCTDILGNVTTEWVWPDCERTFTCPGGVTVTGNAIVHATTLVEIPDGC